MNRARRPDPPRRDHDPRPAAGRQAKSAAGGSEAQAAAEEDVAAQPDTGVGGTVVLAEEIVAFPVVRWILGMWRPPAGTRFGRPHPPCRCRTPGPVVPRGC